MYFILKFPLKANSIIYCIILRYKSIYNYDTSKTLVTMPTGAGKTVLAMETIVDLFRNHNNETSLNIAWIVNSKELCEQSLQSKHLTP